MKRINGLLIAITFLMATSCQFTKNGKETVTENKIEKIQIEAMDMEILTMISIDCDKYIGDIDYSITDTAEINVILSNLKELIPLDSGNWCVDTRAKILLYSQNGTNTICVGFNFLNYNDKFYHTPEWLIEYINNLVNKHYCTNKQVDE
jgi:hypothetical protein